jgi:flagellar biosynthesis protein FlhF
MGFGFTAANSMREFIEAMDEFRSTDVLLIDTPGFSFNDFEFAGDLIRFLRQMTSKEIHLVLPASMNRDDLILYARRYAEFQPDYVLFTKLDETESRGAVLAAALEADKPLSYLAAGQNIPEDIQAPNWPTLLGKLLRREKVAALSAA